MALAAIQVVRPRLRGELLDTWEALAETGGAADAGTHSTRCPLEISLAFALLGCPPGIMLLAGSTAFLGLTNWAVCSAGA
jgi:hypothetical protein